MKHYAFLIVLVSISYNLTAQQDYFVFIQSEHQAPFYAKVNNRQYEASPIGHLTIPRLKDSTYSFVIGFPGKSVREQSFVVNMNGKDRGFVLKENGGKNWVLFDWKSSETVRSQVRSMYGQEEQASGNVTKRNDGFARLMASVVNDSDVLYSSIVKVEVPKVGQDKDVVKKPVSEVRQNNAKTENNIDSPIVSNEKPKTDTVHKEVDKTVSNNKPATTVITDLPKTNTQPDSASQNENRVADNKGRKANEPVAKEHSKGDSLKVENKDVADNRQTVQPKDTLASNQNPVVSKDIVAIKKDSAKQQGPITKAVKKPVKNEPAITKVKEQDNKDGKELVFIENVSLDVRDTVTIVIPHDQPTAKKDTLSAKPPGKPVKSDSLVTPATDTATMIISPDQRAAKKDTISAKAAQNEVKKDSAVTPITDNKVRSVTKTDTLAKPEKEVRPDTIALTKSKDTVAKKRPITINSNCKNFATEADVDKLRVKLLADKYVDDRISTARKEFKLKCYSYKQIRGLSELFVNDEERYKFFDAAYPYVSDTDNFALLVSLLTDTYYINRFNAMLRQ